MCDRRVTDITSGTPKKSLRHFNLSTVEVNHTVYTTFPSPTHVYRVCKVYKRTFHNSLVITFWLIVTRRNHLKGIDFRYCNSSSFVIPFRVPYLPPYRISFPDQHFSLHLLPLLFRCKRMNDNLVEVYVELLNLGSVDSTTDDLWSFPVVLDGFHLSGCEPEGEPFENETRDDRRGGRQIFRSLPCQCIGFGPNWVQMT